MAVIIRGFWVIYDSQESILLCANGRTKLMGKSVFTEVVNNSIKFRVLLDRLSIEIFVNDGEIVFPFGYLPEDDSRDLSVAVRGGTADLQAFDDI